MVVSAFPERATNEQEEKPSSWSPCEFEKSERGAGCYRLTEAEHDRGMPPEAPNCWFEASVAGKKQSAPASNEHYLVWGTHRLTGDRHVAILTPWSEQSNSEAASPKIR